MKRLEIPENELRRLYCEEGKGAQEIAEIFGCTNQTVNARLREYGIRETSEKKIRGACGLYHKSGMDRRTGWKEKERLDPG